MANEILTNSGLWFDFLNPKPDQVCLHDIAHSLSRCCRYGGHTDNHYSIAQHSVFVANKLKKDGATLDTQLAGLLHDAHEAYIGDIVSPLKALLPEIKLLEHKIDKAIFKALGVKSNKANWDAVHAADKWMYEYERTSGYSRPLPGTQPTTNSPVFWTYEKSYEKFVKEYLKLMSEVKCLSA